jgi:hypothetical protein
MGEALEPPHGHAARGGLRDRTVDGSARGVATVPLGMDEARAPEAPRPRPSGGDVGNLGAEASRRAPVGGGGPACGCGAATPVQPTGGFRPFRR